jgi:hypothetical protein
MSNQLAIATVSAALQQVLLNPVSQAVASATVGFSRPDAGNAMTPLVNIFLYQVTPNAAYRNGDAPTRGVDGRLVQRPQAALDLHYLFTFHGNDAQLEPQRLLGAVVAALHAQPLLSTQNIANAVTIFGFLAGSGLENQIERVKFTPTALSLEEFSKLWSVFFQVEYSLSAAYQASVVLIESDLTPQSAPPVMAPILSVVPFQWPRIDRVISQQGAGQPIVTGTTLRILGQQLRGQTTLVLIEGQELTPVSVTNSQITVPVPASVHAGVQAVQVIEKLNLGNPAIPRVPHRVFESNVAAIVLRPTLTNASAVLDAASSPKTKITDVTLTLVPNAGVGQRAVLVLNDVTASPATSYASSSTVTTVDSNQITVRIENVPTGSYLARVQIDGAESLLTVDPNTKQFTGPTVAMP